MTTKPLAPVFFISHGAPTFALDPGNLGPRLGEVGNSLDGVRALVVISPHWQTNDLAIGSAARLETIHDFGPFATELFELQYPAKGAPEVAEEIHDMLRDAGWPVRMDAERGLDHGAWVPLMHMLPNAQIPVIPVSVPFALDTHRAVMLGKALAPLREQGIAIVGSGSMTHNLYEFQSRIGLPLPYVLEFSEWVDEAVRVRDLVRLANYRELAPHAERAHPTEEHFLPLVVAMAATVEDEQLELLGDEITYGVLSMASYGWGLPEAASWQAEARERVSKAA